MGSDNLGVVRVRRRIFNSQSTAGGILTTRVGPAGGDQVAAALESSVRVSAADHLTAQWGGAADDRPPGGDGSRIMARIALDRPSTLRSAGFAYTAALKWSGAGFRPALGFQPRHGFTHVAANVRYGWYARDRTPFRVVQTSLAYSRYEAHDDGRVESAFGALFVNYDLKNGVNGWVGATRREERLVEPLVLSPTATILPGRYRTTAFQLQVFPPPGRRLAASLTAVAGGLYDGHETTIVVAPVWTPSKHLAFGGE